MEGIPREISQEILGGIPKENIKQNIEETSGNFRKQLLVEFQRHFPDIPPERVREDILKKIPEKFWKKSWRSPK